MRIVLIHHPVGVGISKTGHELLDLAEFGEVIARKGAELVLHGHEHVQVDYELPGPTGPVPVHGVASGTSRSARLPAGRNWAGRRVYATVATFEVTA